MEELTKGQKLQKGYRNFIEPYSDHLQFAVTLTLKQAIKMRVKRFENYGYEYFEYWVKLDDEKIQSTINYFTKLLTAELYGRYKKCNEIWAKPLLFTAVEGRKTTKRTHLHLALGNVPKHKLKDIEEIINRIWCKCDFGYNEIKVNEITSGKGWIGYITKEVGYTDNDALDVCSSTIPQFIQKSICA